MSPFTKRQSASLPSDTTKPLLLRCIALWAVNRAVIVHMGNLHGSGIPPAGRYNSIPLSRRLAGVGIFRERHPRQHPARASHLTGPGVDHERSEIRAHTLSDDYMPQGATRLFHRNGIPHGRESSRPHCRCERDSCRAVSNSPSPATTLGKDGLVDLLGLCRLYMRPLQHYFLAHAPDPRPGQLIPLLTELCPFWQW